MITRPQRIGSPEPTRVKAGDVRTDRVRRAPSARLSGLHRDGHLVRLDLDPLARDELADLLRRVLGHPASAATLDELVRLSGGNLQVLAELVRTATERGALVQDRGTWHLVGYLPTTVALDELVDEHLVGVDVPGLAVLELLAVCERFGLADLERRHGQATLEQLEAGRLVSVMVNDRQHHRAPRPPHVRRGAAGSHAAAATAAHPARAGRHRGGPRLAPP
jgi:hypothetical protein